MLVSLEQYTTKMEPVLRGQIKYSDDSKTVWEGRWGMNADAFTAEGSSDLLNAFRYTAASKIEFSVGALVSFKGYFEVTSVNKGSKSQFTDKVLDLEVVSQTTEDGLRVVTGKGSNRFGNFEIQGHFDPLTSTLEVRRIYAPRMGPAPKNITRAQAAASSEGAEGESSIPSEHPHTPNNDKLKLASHPQSPSSPTEVQSTSSKTTPESGKSMNNTSSDASFYTEAKAVLRELKAKDINQWFSSPVDVEALGLRDYLGIVKTPMDLGTIQSKLDSKQYSSWDECLADMRQTFFNALLYNPRGSPAYNAASELNLFLDERVSRISKLKSRTSDPGLTTSIGKRAHKKKKIFEPGGVSGILLQEPVLTVKKTPKSAKATANKSATANKQSTKVKVSVKRIKIVTHDPSLQYEHEFTALSLPTTVVGNSLSFPVGSMAEDEDDVDSFDGLDDTAFAIATPPATIHDGSDPIVESTPLSAVPMLGDIDGYGMDSEAMSPTNLDVTFD